MVPSLLPLILLIAIRPSCVTSSNVTVVVDHCTSSDCYVSPVDQSTPQYHKSLVKLLSGGLPQVLWERISRSEHRNATVSTGCQDALSGIWSGMMSGDEMSYRYVDASSKTPSGFLEGTQSSFGDYDQCINLIKGAKYCMIKTHALGPPVDDWKLIEESRRYPDAVKKINLKGVTVFKDSQYATGLCLPDVCSDSDFYALSKMAMEGYAVKISSKLNCDTYQSTSLMFRLRKLTIQQMVAMAFVLLMVTGVCCATVVHIISSQSVEILMNADDRMTSRISIITSVKNVFVPKKNEERNYGLEVIKIIFVYFAGFSHNMLCLETPLALMIITRHSYFRVIFGTFYNQHMFNEAGLSQLTLISGFVVMYYGLPLVESGRFPIMKAIISRYLNIIPAVMSMVAVDLLWPLSGSGPYFSLVSDFITTKCSKYWWTNLLLINNFLPALDMCVPQTYFSSTVFQLFVISIPVMYLFKRHSVMAGVICSLIIVSGYGTLMYFVSTKRIMPSLFVSINPSGDKTVNYLDYTTIKLHCYISSYFIGFCLAFYVRRSFGRVKHLWYWNLWRFAAAVILQWLATYASSLYNTFHILPDAMVPIYLVIVRIMFHVAMSQLILLICCFNPPANLPKDPLNSNPDPDVKKNGGHNPPGVVSEVSRIYGVIIQPLSKLSVAFYLTNYFYIRYDFFTSRTLFTHGFYYMFKRMASGFTGMIIVAFFFQIFFVSPTDAFRRTLYQRVLRSPTAAADDVTDQKKKE